MTRSAIGRLASLLFLPTLAIGCVRVSSTGLGEPSARSIPVEEVRVFATTAPPTYTEIAVLKTHRFLASDSKTLNALVKRAASMGANGVILLNTRAGGSQAHSGSGVIIGGRADGGVIVGAGTSKVDDFERAVAIRWWGDLNGTASARR
jgi:hypothetical protein